MPSAEQKVDQLVTLVRGLVVWALLLSMEVFDFIDIDIDPGDQLPELTWSHVLAHGQNVVAVLVLLGAIFRAWHGMRKASRGN